MMGEFLSQIDKDSRIDIAHGPFYVGPFLTSLIQSRPHSANSSLSLIPFSVYHVLNRYTDS